MDRYHDLETDLEKLLRDIQARFRVVDFSEAREYLDHAEYALALDTIAGTLASAGTRVDAHQYREFLRLAGLMEFDVPADWLAIAPPR